MVNAVRTNAGSGAELGARLELLTVGQRLAVDQQQFPGEFDPGYANFSSDVDSGVIENHLQTEALASVAANLGILTEIPDGGQVLASARIPFDSPGDATGRFRQAAPLADAPPAPGETDSPGAAETPALHPQTGVAPSETLVSIVAGITGTPAPGNDDLHGTGGPNPVPKIEFTSNATSTEDRPGGDLPVGPSSGPSPDSPGSPGNAGSGSFGSSTGGVDTGNAKTADGSSFANTDWPTAEPASIYGPEQVEKKADGQPDEENDGDSVAGQADDGSTPDNHGRSGKRDTRGKRTDDSSTDSHAKGDDLDAPYAGGSGDEDPEYIDEPEQEEENDGDSVAGQADDGSTPDNHGRSGKRDTRGKRTDDSSTDSHAKGDDLDAPYAAGSGDEDPEYIDEPEQEEENDGDSVAGQAGDGSTPDNHGRSGKRDTRSNDSYVSSHAKDNGESSIATDTHETQVGHTQGDRRARN